MLTEIPYNRDAAVRYAHRWAYRRNPRYYDFEDIGGDCTNYASQCIYAGCEVMNYTPTFGWYYISTDDRTPSWTGVQYLYNFLTANEGAGPYGRDSDISEMMPGDIIQLAFTDGIYKHSPVVVEAGNPATLDNILVAAHSYDCDYRPLTTYEWTNIRYIHILGARKYI